MKDITFITNTDAWPGFRLAGMKQLAIKPENTAEKLLECVDDSSIGLIVIDERLLKHLPENTLQRIDKKHPGKVTILPAPGAEESGFALEIIRQAIGYHVRLQG